MNIKQLIENENLNIEKSKILFDEEMYKHTTFKIGGPAECFIKIDNEVELKQVLAFAKKYNINITILGNGSNVLVLDNGIKGIVLQMKLNELQINEDIVTIGSGVKMGTLAQVLAKNNISGFEKLSGIPGTVGGAVYMNAGAYGSEIKDIVSKVKCIDYEGNEKIFTNEEAKFEYRNSIFKNKKYIITEIEIKMQKGNREKIIEEMQELAKNRKEKQPLEYPNAGSTFKRGEDFITAQLIDQAGLKGYSIGGAEVSEKHSGFIINKNNATAQDILDLEKYVAKIVKERFNKNIELEIEIIGKGK